MLTQPVVAFDDRDFLLRLEGKWKFSIGNNKAWANTDFDDSEWEQIKVPSPWEDQGFYGYDGMAWYRTTFTLTREMKSRDLFLSLGYISDVDQVFINGHLIGFSGTFPPVFSSATEGRRKYPIPDEYLNLQGKNVIAVKVYNHQMAGGIISGEIGIFALSPIKPDFSLIGIWNFKIGDGKSWKLPNYKDENWEKIIVPGNWENQVYKYKEYNGTAWYRKHFIIPDELTNQKLMLIIGRIDNSDEVYVNGVMVGTTGKVFSTDEGYKPVDDNKKQLRAYPIPENLLASDKENTICIRVYSIQNRGGITECPIGFIRLLGFNRYYKDFLEPVQ